jgi:RND family efflux transporter MFP subunit
MVKPSTGFSEKFRHRMHVGIYILLAVAIIGIAMRMIEDIKLRRNTEQQSILTVATIEVAAGPVQEKIVLPGNVQAWHEATIYARTNGYVINWYADIGARVKTGDLLAKISTPEIDSQLRQLEAQLKTAEADYHLANTTAVRWKYLLKTQSVSQQEADEKISNEKAQAFIVTSTRANRDRLRDLVSFEKIIAPFNGIITSRTTDIGRLINAGNGSIPLFRIAQSNPLRVYVRVPQNYVAQIMPGLIAKLYFSQHPGQVYFAKLLGSASAIDLRSRTLLIQLEVSNPNNELLPGSYAEVHLILPSQKNAVRIPVNTLLFQAEGLQVAIVSNDNHVILKPVAIGRDFGDKVEVVSGLKSGERIILNPPDSLIAGEKVRVVASS